MNNTGEYESQGGSPNPIKSSYGKTFKTVEEIDIETETEKSVATDDQDVKIAEYVEKRNLEGDAAIEEAKKRRRNF